MATKAQVAEATGTTIPFEFRGHTYQLPPKIKAKVLRMIDNRQMTLALDAILGAEQAKVFWDRHDDDDVDVVGEFFKASGKVMGGNS